MIWLRPAGFHAMVFRWLTNRRRRRLRNEAFPDPWLQTLDRNVRVYDCLSSSEQRKLRADIQVFVAEKNWEGCGGLNMNEEIKVTIAAQACLLVLAFDSEYYDMVRSILVYPNAYVAPGRTITKGGIVLEGDSHREGEAWYRGPVVLSWADVLAGSRQQSGGDNLVIHEFAHQLDMQNGRDVDGVPVLKTTNQYKRWQQVVGDEYDRLTQNCHHGYPTLLDCYGATNRAEFFAVASECFFMRSHELARVHPALYDVLRDFYGQDPGLWK